MNESTWSGAVRPIEAGTAAVESAVGTARASVALAAGVRVLTLDGEMPAEYLSPGDRIITRSGARRLVAITPGPAPARLVAITAGVLGRDRPGAELRIAPHTPVLLRDWRARAIYGALQVLVPASRLVDGAHIRWVPGGPEAGQMLALAFEEPAILYVEGIEIAATEPAGAEAPAASRLSAR